MDENIAVGVLVGLSIGITAYIWNSDWYTKSQKYVLLLFILFPPLQWITAIMLFIYNYQQFKNTKEYKVETKINSSTVSLKELRDKGILTQAEYQEKILKTEKQKLENDILNSKEYNQLKSLFENGILTKEEFENKIPLLKNDKVKETVKSEIAKPKEDLTVKEEPKKGSSFYFYLGSILFFVILIGASIILHSINHQQIYQESKKHKRFVYIIFTIQTPKLESHSIGSTDQDYTVHFVKTSLSTEIIEVDDYNEDSKKRILDTTEEKVNRDLNIYDTNYYLQINKECDDYIMRERLKENKSTITDRNIHTFNTYSEAVLQKEKLQNNVSK